MTRCDHAVARKRRGFTFIEMLMVMILLGMLSAIAVPRLRLFKERAYLATMRTDLGHLRIAEEAYFAEHQRYGTDTTSLDAHASSHVHVALSSVDPISGYSAIATHDLLPGQQCATYSGKDAGNGPSGTILCGATLTPSGTLTPPQP
jgi:prepilin-type N-terminal cleavage/methylation domain-containing protein